MPTRKERQVVRTRNTIIGVVAAIVVIVVGYGLVYSTGLTEGEYRAGTHFDVIEDAKGRRPGAPIQVREYFSYACIHCRNFDPMIENWKSNLPEGVEFRRVPVTFSPVWALLARTYFALEQLDALEQNHERLFRAIHDQGRQFLLAEMVADYVDGYGVTRAAFLQAFDSAAVRSSFRQAERDQRELGIASVPTLVVDDKYRIGMDMGRRTALDVLDHIIALETSADAS